MNSKRSRSPEGRQGTIDLEARRSAREKNRNILWDSPSRSRSPAKKDAMVVEPKKKKKPNPPSPPSSDSEASAKAVKPKNKKKPSKSVSSSDSDSSDSSDSEPRKKSKNKKKKSKGKSKKKKKKSKKSKKASSSDSESSGAEDNAPNENKETSLVPASTSEVSAPLMELPGDMWEDATKHRPVESEELIGPKPKQKDSALDARNYGGALLPGEGEAIAGFVQAGKRIPRRGEVGVTSDEIETFEKLGYVMSGSRHKRMNAIRIRKENQVYSAEEKRALSLLNFEERANKEKKLMSDFHRYLLEKDSEK